MAAGVVSGAVALLLEQRPNLKPADAKAALQLTSTFLPSAGLVGAGAGELNVLSASELLENGQLGPTDIAAQSIEPSRIAFTRPRQSVRPALAQWSASIAWPREITGNSIVWGASTIHLSTSAQSIVWGASTDDESIVWGASVDAQSIVWGASTDDESIVWGAFTDDQSIVWGASTDDESIVWGALVAEGL